MEPEMKTLAAKRAKGVRITILPGVAEAPLRRKNAVY
jgi:hypothetical protein